MWTTEEQAIKYFKSKKRNIIIIIIKEPKNENLTKSNKKKVETKKKRAENFKIPKVPIFNINLAKIMETAPEELTWALVNQKWRRKRGILNKRRVTKVRKRKKLSEKKLKESKSQDRKVSLRFQEKYKKGTEPKIFIENIKKKEEILSESLE